MGYMTAVLVTIPFFLISPSAGPAQPQLVCSNTELRKGVCEKASIFLGVRIICIHLWVWGWDRRGGLVGSWEEG